MHDQSRDSCLAELLARQAAEAIPDTTDLWPTIVAQLPAQTRHSIRSRTDRAGRRFRLSRPPALAGITAAVLIGLVLSLTGLPWAEPERAVSAAEVLNNLADEAASQTTEPADPNSGYRYLKYQALNLSTSATAAEGGRTYSALIPVTREMWIAPDGSGRIRETAAQPTFLSEQDQAAWLAAGSPPIGHPINQDFGPGELYAEDFTRLPTDPEALYQIIRQRAEQAGPPVDIETFILIGDILRQPGVPPALRAALYKVAAMIPDVELIGHLTDRAGRSGVAVAKTTDYWGGKQRFVLIFDPNTTALLGEETVVLEPVDWLAVAPPVVIGHTTYLESGIVTILPGEPLAPESSPKKTLTSGDSSAQ